MDNMEQKLNAILGNPQMMSQIMSMAQTMGAGREEPQEPAPMAPTVSMPSFDPAMLQKVAELTQRSGIDSHQQSLLHALRPYLSQERIAKLEKAMRAAKLAGIATTFLGSSGLSFLTGR